MTWRWIKVRSEGPSFTLHAVDDGWPNSVDTACGTVDVTDVEIRPDGERYCLRCVRRLAR